LTAPAATAASEYSGGVKEAVAPKAIKKDKPDFTPEFAKVRLVDLEVDRSYQRPVTSKMERMGQNWNDEIAGIITLSRREDGSLWILDGQNRVGAAMMAGREELPADIREGLTLEEEAELFDRLNSTHTNVTAIDRFKARKVYRDPEALDIESIVQSHGGAIAEKLGASRQEDTAIRAVASLNRIYRKAGRSGLDHILSIISKSWGGIDYETTNELTLGGLFEFISRQKKFDEARLVERLNEEGLSNIKRMAHAHGQIFGGSGNKNFYRAVLEVYNKNLHTRSRLN
jgi:hypothetical protein